MTTVSFFFLYLSLSYLFLQMFYSCATVFRKVTYPDYPAGFHLIIHLVLSGAEIYAHKYRDTSNPFVLFGQVLQCKSLHNGLVKPAHILGNDFLLKACIA